MPDQNPYETPTVTDSPPSTRSVWLTHRSVRLIGWLLIGIGIILGSNSFWIVANVGSAQPSPPRVSELLVLCMNGAAGVAILVGVGCIVGCHWFPNPHRKFSRQRKNKPRRGRNHLE